MTSRRRFYLILLLIYPLFLMLHLNGLLAHTYWWALEALHDTQSFRGQLTAAFISSIILFGAAAVLYETAQRRSRRPPATRESGQ